MALQFEALRFVEEQPMKMNITDMQASMFGGVLIAAGVVAMAASGIVMVYTFITPTPENMKTCEKLIIYNIVVPDFLLGILLVQILGPAVLKESWKYSRFSTQWLAFFHVGCIFHPHMALAFTCKIIALSLTDVYRFEGANNIKYMAALVLSTASLTICFCSLPAPELDGYIFLNSWLGPWFNLRYQFGSSFMLGSLTGVIVPVDLANIFQLFKAKRVLKEQGTKVTPRALEDMTKIITFTIIMTVSVLPAIIAAVALIQNQKILLLLRFVVYLLPVIRAWALLYLCPHFQFGRAKITDTYLDDFTKLGDEEVEVPTEKLENIIAGGEDEG